MDMMTIILSIGIIITEIIFRNYLVIMDHQKTAKELMNTKLITIQMEDSLIKAFDLMADHHIRHLPVLDAHGDCIGILSDRDIRQAMKSVRDGIEVRMELNPKHKVKDFMSWPALTIQENMSIRDLCDRMAKEKISALIVLSTQTQKPRGIITTEDCLKLLVKILDEMPDGRTKTLKDFEGDFAHLI